MDNELYFNYQVFLLNNILTDLEDAIDMPNMTLELYKRFIHNKMEKYDNFFVAHFKDM